jgi:hypothetical protein
MLISGKLPFQVQGKDFLSSFEQLAKFDSQVQVHQIESSEFTTILAQPSGDSRSELFLWGETPLGVFSEPTSLNVLISEAQDEQPMLDVLTVKNGAYFCVFVEKQTGLTFQLGTENLTNPYEDHQG